MEFWTVSFMSKIKIFISYHDEHHLIKSNILQPIQTGCAKAKTLFDGMLRDDIGENISVANERYCELTAQYWVWKNYDILGNPDYVGFMHYRRHFMFDDWSGNPDWCWLPKGNVYVVPYITPNYLCHIADEKIQDMLRDCDCIVLKPYDLKYLDSQNIRSQYAKLPDQKPEVFDIFIEVMKQLYPNYLLAIQQLENGSIQYLCNMFVMKKELFFQYSEFCFSILGEVDKRVDSSHMSTAGLRFLGYLGEFCLSVFMFQILAGKKYKVQELNGSFILSDDVIFPSKRLFWYYYFLSKITFGSKRKQYKLKRNNIKRLIENLPYKN